MEWINIKDRLPDDGQEVVIFSEGCSYFAEFESVDDLGIFQVTNNFGEIDYPIRVDTGLVTHWMPELEPPKP